MKSYTKCVHLFMHVFMYLLNPFDGQGKVIDRWTFGRVRSKSEVGIFKTWSPETPTRLLRSQRIVHVCQAAFNEEIN